MKAVDLGVTEAELAPLVLALRLPSTAWSYFASLLASENNAILLHAKPSSDEAFSTVKDVVMRMKEAEIPKAIVSSGVGPTTEFMGWREFSGMKPKASVFSMAMGRSPWRSWSRISQEMAPTGTSCSSPPWMKEMEGQSTAM